MARAGDLWDWIKALPGRVFEVVYDWAERVYDKYGRFVLRLWKRGGSWRILAVFLAPVQAAVWGFLWVGGWILGFVGLMLVLAGYMAAIAAASLPFIAIYGVLLLIGVHPGDTGSSPNLPHNEPTGFCSTHACIPSFDEGRGYPVECADGEWSDSGGIQGACSYHGGER
jgi:hypothetical protein